MENEELQITVLHSPFPILQFLLAYHDFHRRPILEIANEVDPIAEPLNIFGHRLGAAECKRFKQLSYSVE